MQPWRVWRWVLGGEDVAALVVGIGGELNRAVACALFYCLREGLVGGVSGELSGGEPGKLHVVLLSGFKPRTIP
jgi:hypothetical protein